MKVNLIQGGIHRDKRGILKFINNFDLSSIKRMYHLNHGSIEVIRGWQGHKKETKWFYCSRGSFNIDVLIIDDWDNPSSSLAYTKYKIDEKATVVLQIPGGHLTRIRALQTDSDLIVFSDFGLLESQQDDYRFDLDQWK